MSQAKKIKVTSKKAKVVSASTIRRKLRKRLKYYAGMQKKEGDRPWYGWYVVTQMIYYNLLGETPPDYLDRDLYKDFPAHEHLEDEDE